MAYNVLVVEDHPFQYKYLLDIFVLMGDVSVESAHDGYEALEALKDNCFDMVLSDLMMPGMDGMQFIQKLGSYKHKPALAIMNCTSRRIMVSARLAANSLGFKAVGLITHPADLIDLRKMHETVLSFGSELAVTVDRSKEHDFYTIKKALAEGQICPWFQPKKSLVSGRIVAAEALARWQKSATEILLPSDFLSGVIYHNFEKELLMRVVSHTIGAQSTWRMHGYDIPVSINVPTHLLDSQDLPDRLHDLVLSEGGVPSKIGFELMESTTTKNPGQYFTNVCRLRIMGFGLVQDDFGKGYSSYFNLVSTPFTELKIDRSLVNGCAENENLAAVLTSIVTLGKQLGLNVVAEGVETQEELVLLSRIKCDQIQGFLVSKALDPGAFLRMLSAEDAVDRDVR